MSMILRREFLKRMAFAALATWFLDLPLPKGESPEVTRLQAGDELFYDLPAPRPFTVYVRFLEREGAEGAAGWQDRSVVVDEGSPEVVDVLPFHWSQGYVGGLIAIRGKHSLETMRSHVNPIQRSA